MMGRQTTKEPQRNWEGNDSPTRSLTHGAGSCSHVDLMWQNYYYYYYPHSKIKRGSETLTCSLESIQVNGGFSSIGVTLGGALALRFEPRTQMRNDYAELKLTQVWNRRGTCFCLLLYLSFNKQKDSTVLPL